MLRQKINQIVLEAAEQLGVMVTDETKRKIAVTYPEPKLGDYATNAALILAKENKTNPAEFAKLLISKMDPSEFETIASAGPGFINFKLKMETLIAKIAEEKEQIVKPEKILLEYFQPNIAKPLHIGHLRTAIIGDAISRMLKFLGHYVESDTHMGDWGTQFGFLILAYKKYGTPILETDPINELNKLYIKINEEAEANPALHEEAKQEFLKLEQGDSANHAIWKKFVDWSMEKFLKINELMNIQQFDHHWPESFYQDKMPKVLMELKGKGILKESQGAQIVDLESQGLGVALILKSDGGTTYLLRDLATFIYRKSLGFKKQLYVVDVRQGHAFKQLFAVLKMLGHLEDDEGVHIDFGFMSFKGEVLSTRKGNMVLAEEMIAMAKEKVAKIIAEKNPELANAQDVITAVAQGAVKYFDLSHNRHSDIEFDWDKALDFEGNSGPYLQYTHARLCSILRKAGAGSTKFANPHFSETEKHVLFQTSILEEMVEDSVKDYLPNVLANYLYNFVTLLNRFYHESPVTQEKDEAIKQNRLALVTAAKKTLARGLDLLGIDALEEM
ncbi:MAG: arginine--tRNA ligase [Candidatus Doudnabacteria bacterium]|nr:arginine--tRNA ligase [Candidatus Doudnabacteria bacterium]